MTRGVVKFIQACCPMQQLEAAKSRFMFAFVLACLSIVSCNRENLTDTERLMSHNWKLDKYSVNGIDKTGSLLIQDFMDKIEDYDFYGYSYSFINSNQDTIAENGSSYYLYSNEDSVYFYSSYEIPLTVEDTIRGYRFTKIIRLTKSAFVYEFALNGRLHEFQMVRSK
jgi:hypothetical protein